MMSDKAKILSVNISEEKGTVKKPQPEIHINHLGIDGDAHAGSWHRQVSILGQESVEDFVKRESIEVEPGDFGENITIGGIDLRNVAILDRFRIGEVGLEVTQIGKECHGEGCTIYRQVGQCVMPKEGIFTRVLSEGTIMPGDEVMYYPKTLSFEIITLSDRAFRGEYEDRSGPKIREILEVFLSGKRWHPKIESVILPDEPERLRSELASAQKEGVDIIFTTGGTGVGPRDNAPETVSDFCDRLIPGIMEHIRVKYGSTKPNALLSRSVAGVAGEMLIFTLPGGLKAVQEYMIEILPVLEHLVYMVHGLDNH
jgi:molybdenum cofactor synthesis domain-containing protein